jgi:hypothetical protein
MAGLIYNLLDWLTDRLVEVMILIDPQKSSRNSTLDYTVSELPDEILRHRAHLAWYKQRQGR